MSILVTGRSGTGKSTICGELQSMGVPAYDMDRLVGLCSWIDVTTGISTSVDYTKPIDKRKVGCFWNPELLTEYVSQHPSGVFCGSADNQLALHTLFGKVIVLSVSPEEQAKRIMAREEHSYGQSVEMLPLILDEQAALIAKTQAMGAVILNANRGPQAIALDVLRHVRR